MDPDPSSSLISLVYIAVLVVANALFVAAEYAFISFNPVKKPISGDEDVDEILTDHPAVSAESVSAESSEATRWLLKHSEICVASIQLGISLCSLAIGYLGITYFHAVLAPLISSSFSGVQTLSSTTLEYASLGLSFFLAILFLTFLHVIFAELFVKAIATAFPDATLLLLARPLKLFSQITYPISSLIYSLANVFLKPLQLTLRQSEETTLSLAEIKRLFSSGPTSSEIGTEQARMIRGVVGFSETIAREVMTPRTDLVTIKVDATLDEVVKTILDTGFSRYPVRGERVDDVLGILLARDVMPFVVASQTLLPHRKFEVRKVMRQPYYIPGTKAIDELLNEFRRRKIHMSIILDEHGGVDGVVTLEDIMEEIVGDIYDESDETENDFVRDVNGDLLIDGGVLVADLNERFELSIPEGQYDTIAGFIFTCMGQIPKTTDQIFINKNNDIFVNGVPEKATIVPKEDAVISEIPTDEEGICIAVEKVEGHRIEMVRMQFLKDNQDQILASDESESEQITSELKSVVAS